MVKLGRTDKSPTMIIPQGTAVQVDVHGQLSIRTPGNLVIQNSGHYSTLESTHGSIRIESEAEVEAVNVRCAGGCFVAGTLTAWKVEAESIHLESTARANIVLQETERLEVGHEARLVGNFGSEKELFYLFSRFANELRSLPMFGERQELDEAPIAGLNMLPEAAAAPLPAPAAPPPTVPGPSAQSSVSPDGNLPDPLFFSLVILEREFTRPSYGPTSRRVLEELIKLLQARDLETLRLTYQTLFGRIVEPGKDVQRVHDLMGRYFQQA